MQSPLNITLLLILIVTYGGAACLYMSTEALDRIGRKMRARSRGLIASRAAFHAEYQRSMDEDQRAEEGRKLRAELERQSVEVDPE